MDIHVCWLGCSADCQDVSFECINPENAADYPTEDAFVEFFYDFLATFIIAEGHKRCTAK